MDITNSIVNGDVEILKIAETEEYATYSLFFGPNHPGMSGNFGYVFDVVGTRISKVRINAGLLHRGFEKLMEQNLWIQNMALIPRLCVVDPDPNEVAYCTAIEKLAGIEVPLKAKYIRTITLEMSRMTSLLMSIGGMGGALGLYSATYRMMTERDMILDLFEWLTGGRVYHIFNQIGGVRRDLPDGWVDRITYVLDYIENCFTEYDKLVYENPVVHARLGKFAEISGEDAINFGLTGPNVRATGVNIDVRRSEPYAAYPYIDYKMEFAGGDDALARAVQLRIELELSIDIIRKALKQFPKKGSVRADVGNPLRLRIPEGVSYAAVESSKGEFGYMIVSDGGLRPYRVSVRGPSAPGGIALAKKQLIGMKIDDVPVWMASFGVCPPDIDK